MNFFRLRLLTLLTASICRAQGTDLSGNLTVDNGFTVYLSTSDSLTGTAITLSSGGTWWADPGAFTTALTPGVVNYLHVVTTDAGYPQGFIGEFTLSNTAFNFVNGTQSLLTSPSEFQLSLTGFGSGYSTPASLGVNGVGPWGNFPGINASAQWLDFPPSGTGYFSAPITPVPEPAEMAELMGFVVLAFCFAVRRYRRPAVAP